MRLLDTTTLEFVEFADDDLPQYAILSHTWGSQEVTLHDLINTPHSVLEGKAGFQKIKSCCEKAWITLGLRFCWIDTCCIDKSSSAELSEAINSMFKWYAQAFICYAYLSDVQSESESDEGFKGDLELSRWFTHGWTLQELIAPAQVLFFNKDWLQLGSKSTLTEIISTITGIDTDTLLDPINLSSASVARRMSWAASRETTRVEDIAYCLMGIFNVNMPLLYGEGERAFTRLQEEIIKESNDQSILAWSSPQTAAEKSLEWHTLGILARHPSMFKDAGSIELLSFESNPMIMTSRGLQVQLPIIIQGAGKFSAITNCAPSTGTSFPYHLAIPLQHTAIGDGSLGRRPHDPLELIYEGEANFWLLHTVYLLKSSASVPKALRFLPFHLWVWNAEENGYYLHKSIFTTKPLTSLTTYQNLNLSWRHNDAPKGNIKRTVMTTRLEFPPGRSDIIIALHFAHIVDRVEGFVILWESRRVRQYWSSNIVACAKHADMEAIVERLPEHRTTYADMEGGHVGRQGKEVRISVIAKKSFDEDAFYFQVQFFGQNKEPKSQLQELEGDETLPILVAS